MLRVQTYIKKAYRDQIEIGFGLFALNKIPKGTIIWKLDHGLDLVLDQAVYPEPINSFIKKYAYREGYRLILCSDDARYINHSFNPNMHDYVDSNGSWTVALCDIEAGEELTSDYRSFDSDPLHPDLK